MNNAALFAPREWKMAEIWNQSLLEQNRRATVARKNLWASELGKAPIELYLKLKGVEASNPPNARALRKFEAGNVFEWIVSLILQRAGILQESQKWVSHQYPGLLEVTGKADFIAGGMPNSDAAIAEMEALGLPDIFLRATKKILEHLTEFYPEGLEKMPLEIKSVSSYMFDGLEANNRSMKGHRMQTFHYLKAMNFKKAHIVYICRDDLRMLEIPVLNPGPVEDEYKNSIAAITEYVKSGEQPPLEDEIIFDEDIGKFSKNWNVEYSNYLTMLYGYKDPMEFYEKIGPIADRWNRVLTRAKTGKDITAKNEEVIEEIKSKGFDFDECVRIATPDQTEVVTE